MDKTKVSATKYLFLGSKRFLILLFSHPLVWCELKRKRKGLVRKRRVSVNELDLALRLTSMNEADWEGDWFRSQLDLQCLRPVCQVT